MTDIRRVTPDFAVAAQLSVEDVARAAAAGYRTLINNRPEGEVPDQPSEAEIGAEAARQGLRFVSIPFAGPPPPGAVAATAELLEETPEATLAYCRSGRRSILAWAMAQALRGAMRPEEIIKAAAGAGYDLEGVREALEGLSPQP
jgi:sulfide:quinone oxidoreductase